MTATKYGNLYPKEFLNYFGNNEKLISDIKLEKYELEPIEEITKNQNDFYPSPMDIIHYLENRNK